MGRTKAKSLMEDGAMIEWRRVLSLVVRPHSVASNWPTGLAEGIVRLPAGGTRTSARAGSQPNPGDPPARLWTISTEFLVEAEPDECTRFGGTG
jgi:hypothetical protein